MHSNEIHVVNVRKVIDLLVNVKRIQITYVKCQIGWSPTDLQISEYFELVIEAWKNKIKFNTDFWRKYYGKYYDKLLSLCPAVHMSYHYSKTLWWILIIFGTMFVIMEWSPLFFSIVFWFFISKLWDYKHRKRWTAVSCALAQLFIFIIDIHVYCTCTIFI